MYNSSPLSSVLRFKRNEALGSVWPGMSEMGHNATHHPPKLWSAVFDLLYNFFFLLLLHWEKFGYDSSFLGFDATWFGLYIPALHRNLLPVFVGYTAWNIVICLQKLCCITSQKDHAIIQVVTPWIFTLEAWVPYQGVLCGICGTQSGTQTGSCLNVSVFHC